MSAGWIAVGVYVAFIVLILWGAYRSGEFDGDDE